MLTNWNATYFGQVDTVPFFGEGCHSTCTKVRVRPKRVGAHISASALVAHLRASAMARCVHAANKRCSRQPNSRFELETFCLQNRRTANCANLAKS